MTQKPESLRRPTVGTLRPLRVLVVDDLPDSAATMATLIGLDGHEVYTAADGPTALALAAERPPDVALLDIGLPGMDGWKVAERLRELGGEKRPWLVAVTGYGTQEDRLKSVQAGIDLHLTKPAIPEQLLGLLRRLQRIIG